MFAGALSSLPLRRRPVRSRVQVFFRADPEAVAARLPDGVHPRTWRGVTLGEIRFTRLDPRSALWGPLGARADHLSYRLAVDLPTDARLVPGSWVLERRTSSWFEAACGSSFKSALYARSRFALQEDGSELRLLIGRAGRPELALRAECVARSTSVLFPSARAVQSFLSSGERVEPFDPFAPEVDDPNPPGLVPEPLCVQELDCALLRALPAGAAQVDSAWRWVSRPRTPLVERAFERSESAVPAT